MLNPENIFIKINKGDISLDKGVVLLKSLIEANDNAKIRAKSIEIICKLMDSKEELFNVLENCLISDKSPTVRKIAAKEIVINFPKKCIIPLRWTIQHDKSNVVIKKVLNLIEENTNSELLVLKKDLDERFLNSYGVLGEEAKFCLDFEIFYPKWGIKRIIKISDDNHIIELDLGGSISRIPKSFSSLKWLKKLEFSYKTKSIPKYILPFAAELGLHQEYIDDGVNPNDAIILWLLESLTGIKLVNSKLGYKGYFTYKTDQSGNVVRLIVGDVEDVYLRIFPKQIFSLKKLKKLNLSINVIPNLPEINKKNNTLKYLNLSFNNLKSLPKSIDNLSSLEKLVLEYNKLNEIPESIGKLEKLKELFIDKNNIKEIPESIGNLKSLKILSLSENNIEKIPDSIGNLKSLEILDLSENNIEVIPDSIGNLESLNTLYLYRNNIKKIPNSIKNLKSLKYLELQHNNIKDVDDSMKNWFSSSKYFHVF